MLKTKISYFVRNDIIIKVLVKHDPGCEREEIENLGQISTYQGNAASFLAKRVVFLRS